MEAGKLFGGGGSSESGPGMVAGFIVPEITPLKIQIQGMVKASTSGKIPHNAAQGTLNVFSSRLPSLVIYRCVGSRGPQAVSDDVHARFYY